ncbi:MAG TPA: DUF3306 domain-containing protein [Bosea sp. (in: a-proteobacteria)]
MSAGAPEDEGFLSRWSRRKREQAEPAATPAPALEQPADATPRTAEAAPAEPEPVEPPSLDLVDKDFDLAPWLKQNVPESWKLAALRRAWESDPAIAGFENPARDYALDWNTPGGAPGYGPLTESDDVGAMVRSIFGGEPEAKDPVIASVQTPSDRMSHQLSSNDESVKSDAAPQEESPPPAAPAAIRLSGEGEGAGKIGSGTAEPVSPVYAAVQNNPDREGVSTRIRKRGGGAIPI